MRTLSCFLFLCVLSLSISAQNLDPLMVANCVGDRLKSEFPWMVNQGIGVSTATDPDINVDAYYELVEGYPVIRLNHNQYKSDLAKADISNAGGMAACGFVYVYGLHELFHIGCCHPPYDPKNIPADSNCDELAVDLAAFNAACQEADDICSDCIKSEDPDGDGDTEDDPDDEQMRMDCQEQLDGLCEGIAATAAKWNENYGPGETLAESVIAACEGLSYGGPCKCSAPANCSNCPYGTGGQLPTLDANGNYEFPGKDDCETCATPCQ